MQKAYSYLRFSTPEQARGDSFRRQTALARDYALRNGIELDDKLTFRDLGVSAFRGKNAETGRLAEFLQAVKDTLVPVGSLLLVESLDRVSRDYARRALRVLEEIVDSGVTLVTLSDGRHYTSASLNEDPTSLLMALLIFIRGNEESATKARRLRASWAAKRAKAAEQVMSARGPAWLRLNGDKRWEVLEERAAIVRRIYGMALEGRGEHTIAAALNRDGIATWGDNGRRPAVIWHRSYVMKVLRSSAVVGTLLPFTMDHTDGRKARKAETPVEGYYPPIVDRQVWEDVQAMRIGAINPQRGRHAREPIKNVLGGLAKCHSCGSTMTRVSKGSRRKAGRPFLICVRAKTGAGCAYRPVFLEDIERALVYQAANWGFIGAPADDDDESDIRSARTDLAEAQRRVDNLAEAVARSGMSAALQVALADAERDLSNQKTMFTDRTEFMDAVNSQSVMKRDQRLRDCLTTEPLDREAANSFARQLFSRVVIDSNYKLATAYRKGADQPIAVMEIEPLYQGLGAP